MPDHLYSFLHGVAWGLLIMWVIYRIVLSDRKEK